LFLASGLSAATRYIMGQGDRPVWMGSDVTQQLATFDMRAIKKPE
jgi:hypothetical protein